MATDLSQAEKDAIASMLKAMSDRAGHQISLDKLINDWQRLVVAIERGYDDSIYEYTNDLSARSLLGEVLAKAPAAIADKVRRIVEPLDQKFMATTRQTTKPLLSQDAREEDFWWFRIPTKLLPELRRDLVQEGLIERDA